MSDEIIDLTRYLEDEPGPDLPRGAMALWGAEGERSRFALPLWRAIYLSGGDRGLLVSTPEDGGASETFVALDIGQEPARLGLPEGVPPYRPELEAALVEVGPGALAIHLGRREGRVWTLVVDGPEPRGGPLDARSREDILFLAGECAGLLFARALADPETIDGRSEAE